MFLFAKIKELPTITPPKQMQTLKNKSFDDASTL
jgi:hypothetical protein